jgi:hypothetical protein
MGHYRAVFQRKGIVVFTGLPTGQILATLRPRMPEREKSGIKPQLSDQPIDPRVQLLTTDGDFSQPPNVAGPFILIELRKKLLGDLEHIAQDGRITGK